MINRLFSCTTPRLQPNNVKMREAWHQVKSSSALSPVNKTSTYPTSSLPITRHSMMKWHGLTMFIFFKLMCGSFHLPTLSADKLSCALRPPASEHVELQVKLRSNCKVWNSPPPNDVGGFMRPWRLLLLRGGAAPYINYTRIRLNPFTDLDEMDEDAELELDDRDEHPLIPRHAEKKLLREIEQLEAKHGVKAVEPGEDIFDPPVTFDAGERELHSSEYIQFKRPGIVNKLMWAAAETGDDEELDQIITHLKADVNTVDVNIYNYTALFWAAMNGHLSTVRLLVSRGADVNATDAYGSTPLHYAADRGWPHIVDLLVQLKCDVFKKNQFNRTAYDWAKDIVMHYNVSRTPVEDKDWLPGRDVLDFAVGSNLQVVVKLRKYMRKPPLDKLHVTGALKMHIEELRASEKEDEWRCNNPETVLEMQDIMPDGRAFHPSLILNQVPRSVHSQWYEPDPPRKVVWPNGTQFDIRVAEEREIHVRVPNRAPQRAKHSAKTYGGIPVSTNMPFDTPFMRVPPSPGAPPPPPGAPPPPPAAPTPAPWATTPSYAHMPRQPPPPDLSYFKAPPPPPPQLP